MDRLRQPGDSDYDVLGISSGATDEEIDRAFRELIDGEGYRVGVPLNRQWLRAHQIKAAYAALRDPAKRRTSNKRKSRANPAKDPSVAPMAKPTSAKSRKIAGDPGSAVPTNAVLSDSAPIGPTNAVPSDSAPIRVFGKPPAPRLEELIGMMGSNPPPPDVSPPLNDNEGGFAPTLNDKKPASIRSWGVATALVFGLGLVLLSSWPERDRQQLVTETAPGVTAGKEATAKKDSVLRDLASAQSRTVMKPAGTDPSASKPLSSANAEETRAIAASQKPPVIRASESKSAGTRSRSRPVGTAPQWLGGGPTNADNQQGRYEGRVALQVSVERSGRVSNCAPVRGSGNAELDALTCRLVRERARFTPARDSRGRPVAGQAYTTFVWVPGQGN